MGIPKLNKYLTERCTNKSIGKKHLSFFSNKILVIDTSIYMYKFISHGDLLEDMYLFISILLEYSIIPIFVFDGKPPPEKKGLLIKRNDDKKKAENEYNMLCEQLQSDISDKEEEKIKTEMLLLKKKCVRLKDKEIKNVKKLMDAYGVTYFDAINEADELCAYLINNNIAYGCISDDMDMFMYGCKYIIRHLSLLNHTMIVYDYDEICNNLDLNDNELKDILLLCGTDYDLSNHNNIYDVFKWYKEYSETDKALDFYNYVNKNKKEIDVNNILNLKNMFICNNNYNVLYKDMIISNKNPNKNDLKDILEPIGFFWVN
tara:strand:- start:1195 stop:2145 length:951 start_codon:yes stop_codon:yes gene_type:complete